LDQAHEVVTTVTACPDAEGDMLAVAREGSLRLLKDEGRKKRLAAIDPDDLHRQQHAARCHRHWRDEMGMVRLSGAMVPEIGVPFMNRLDVMTSREWRAGYREGRPEPHDRHAADAFAQMVGGEGKGHSERADVVYVCDVTTGASHVVGGGPVPESVVREVARTGFIKAALHEGVKVDTIVHYGRKKLPALLRSVLELGDAPDFDGVEWSTALAVTQSDGITTIRSPTVASPRGAT
jgi:hypothetical protein